MNIDLQCEMKDIDRYKRIVAVCRTGGEDLNAWMVSEGWAMSYRRYSPDYIRQEDNASRSKVGIWQGEFIAPWDWRRGKRLTQTQQPGACLIKGNISRNGGLIRLRRDFDWSTRLQDRQTIQENGGPEEGPPILCNCLWWVSGDT